jgi:type I restriction enzyme S subunit
VSLVHKVKDLVDKNETGLTGKASHWERVELGRVARVLNGFPFESRYFDNESGEPVIRIRDVLPGRARTLYKGPAQAAPWVKDGDLVIGMDGNFNCRLWLGGTALLNQRVCAVLPAAEFYSNRFLSYVLPSYLKLINDHTSAVTVKHLSSLDLEKVPLPLPPRQEQDRLASKIDELFSRIDEGERALKRAQKLVERYRQSVLKAAVTGELTREWREKHKGQLESGEALLARILKARREAWERAELEKMKAKGRKPPNENWRLKYQSPPKPAFGFQNQPPACWAELSLEQVTRADRPIAYGVLQPGEDREDGVPLVRVCDIADGLVNIDGLKRINSTIANAYPRTQLHGGEVLLTLVGSVGRTAVVPASLKYANVARAVGVLEPVS